MSPLIYWNRLQIELARRRIIIISFHVWLISAVAILIGFFSLPQRGYATEPTNYNPSAVPNVENNLPATVQSCLASFTCDVAIYNNQYGGSYPYTNQTCVLVNFSQYGGDYTFATGDTPTKLQNYYTGALNDSVGWGQWCWSGGVWSQTSCSGGSCNPRLSCGPDMTACTGGAHPERDPQNLMKSTWTARAPNYDFTTKYNNLGNKNGQIIVQPNWLFPTVTVSNSSPVYTGTRVKFTVTWSDLAFSPYNLYFYADTEFGEDAYEEIIKNTDIEAALGTSGTGSVSFYYTMNDIGSYGPFVVLGGSSCTAPIRGSCSASGSDVGSLIVNPIPILHDAYTVQLDFAKYNDVNVGQPIYYEYNIDPDYCSGSSISGKRIFHGYNPNTTVGSSDTGTILSVNTGDGYMSWADWDHQLYGDFVCPYVHVYCADGTYRRIYGGGAINYNGIREGAAKCLSVYINAADRSRPPPTWLAGGYSDNFTASGTYLFQAEKHVYTVGETVKTKYQFFPTSAFGTIDEVRFYPDEDNLTYYYTSDTTDSLGITPESPHYFNFEYNKSGDYKPSVKLISASGSTIQFWLGGTQIKKEGEWLSVRTELSTLGGGTGSGYGIFGLDPSTFNISFGENPNEALQLVESSLNYVLKGVLYLASLTFDLLRRAPIYSTFVETMHPESGNTYILPNTLFGIDLPDYPTDRAFTIAYATGSNYTGIYQLIIAMVTLGFISTSIKQFL